MIGPDQPLPVSIRADPAAVAQYHALWDVLLRDEAIRALRPLTVRNFLGFVRRIAGPNVDPMEVRLHWTLPQILELYHRVQKRRCSVPVVRAHARWMTTWLGRTVAPRVLSCSSSSSSGSFSSLVAKPTMLLHVGEKKHYFDVDEVQRLYASARLDPSGLDPAILTILFTTGLIPATCLFVAVVVHVAAVAHAHTKPVAGIGSVACVASRGCPFQNSIRTPSTA